MLRLVSCSLCFLLALMLGLTAEVVTAQPPKAKSGESEASAEDRQFQTVADRYWKILQARPRRDTAFDLWYRHYIDAGKLDDLVQTVQQQATAKPENLAAQLLLGLVLERRGQDVEALAAYSAAEQLAADNYYPAFLRGAVLARQQRPDEAATAFAKAIGLNPPRSELLDLYKRLGRLYLQQGKTAEALSNFSQMAEKFPDDRQVLEELAQLLAEERQIDEAIRRWEQVAKLAADDPYQQLQARIEVAQLKITQGGRKDGIALLDQALDRAKPESWLERDIRRRIEQAFQQGEDLAGLVAWCEARLQLRPQDLGTLLQLAGALLQSGKGSEALVRYDEAIKLAPSRRDLREAFIEALVNQGKLPAAVAQCQLLADKHPQDADVLLRLGQLHLHAAPAAERQAAEQKAVEIWKRIAAIRPADAGLALQVAEACRHAASPAKIRLSPGPEQEPQPKIADAESLLLATAEAYYREAVRRAPTEPPQHEYLGEFLHSRGRRNEAIAAWSKISELPSESAESWHRLAELFVNFSYLPEAAEACSKALTLKPNDFDLHDFYLGVLLKQKKHEQAAAELAHLDRVAGEPRREQVLKRRVEVYVAGDRVDAEIERLQQAATENQAEVNDQWLLGLMLTHRWRFAEAGKAFEAALAKAGDNIPLHQAYAETLKRGSDLGPAVEQYQRLSRLDPRYRFTYYQEIIQLELQRGRASEAKQTADLLVKLSPSNLDGYRVRAGGLPSGRPRRRAAKPAAGGQDRAPRYRCAHATGPRAGRTGPTRRGAGASLACLRPGRQRRGQTLAGGGADRCFVACRKDRRSDRATAAIANSTRRAQGADPVPGRCAGTHEALCRSTARVGRAARLAGRRSRRAAALGGARGTEPHLGCRRRISGTPGGARR